VSSLQLVGIGEIEGERLEVVSDDEMIEPGTPIRVVRVDGRRIIVRRVAAGKEVQPTTRSEP
jgi:membrane-bound serine protease (ClpP class)